MPPPVLNAMAIRLDQRMTEKVGGRMWTSAHMRRGVSSCSCTFLLGAEGEWRGGREWRVGSRRAGKLTRFLPLIVQDFIHHEWVMNQDGYAHFNRIKEWMGKGRE